jgi:hypothetical protein
MLSAFSMSFHVMRRTASQWIESRTGPDHQTGGEVRGGHPAEPHLNLHLAKQNLGSISSFFNVTPSMATGFRDLTRCLHTESEHLG